MGSVLWATSPLEACGPTVCGAAVVVVPEEEFLPIAPAARRGPGAGSLGVGGWGRAPPERRSLCGHTFFLEGGVVLGRLCHVRGRPDPYGRHDCKVGQSADLAKRLGEAQAAMAPR